MNNIKKSFFMVLSLILIIGSASLFCSKSKTDVLKMATTTSTDNTGLLDYLKPNIEKDIGIDLQWVAVGTGKALELGKNCESRHLFSARYNPAMGEALPKEFRK